MSDKDKKPCAFVIDLDEGQSQNSTPPKCITEKKSKPITPRDIAQKQEEAEARRKALQDEKLQHIKDVTEGAKK